MIEIKNLRKEYEDGFVALKNINLSIKKGELLVLIGPSGCGKTTTMKMINRLIDPTSGQILVGGKDTKTMDVVELRRNIGYVIQSIGLFPHMTIAENVALVPKLKGRKIEDVREKINELMNMVGLDPEVYADRYPGELSGGQQQRIGVIRALAAEPDIILMDEPFSALDPISREQLQSDLVDLQEKINKTIVFVTHDMDEAIKIADRICIMKQGEIVQLDTPEKILRHPKNDFVKEFIGMDRLGQNYSLPAVREALEKAITVRPNKGLAETIKIMRKYRVDSLLVVDKDKNYLGRVSAWDVQKYYENEEYSLKDLMKNDVETTLLDEDLEIAIEKIYRSDAGYLPVLDEDNKLQGVVTKGGLMQAMADEFLDI